ncbi:M20/M25/M40 family metallo-hydrolase [Streptomyces sp. MAR25Y5]|uniref:M20/M25/M40 family metallo-hydrolase n=1 Tax=Streptomyces sp. MAR25Y5 TaxID=2962028 RepID=UPI0020B814F7|nr:M20/M25/M40 family metallo-hydrolase [Streptomyces sp. MAR25Y5]MCP3771082.1 M20/M25/M40 family metallo-hydrolase [Streptomyces sp. MAR25Y5]
MSAPTTTPDTAPSSSSPPPARRRARLPRWLPLLVPAVLAVLAVLAVAPPDPLPDDADPARFSAGRAEADLRVVAAEPHPLGSPRQEQVRNHLVSRLEELGARVDVETDQVTTRAWGSPYPVATVHNIVATLPGRAPAEDGALLVVAHYDSAPGAPGAADDGAAVAAMLECLRALGTGDRPDRDVVLLFTDGEELGALGARAYVRRHGVDGVAAVLNWEARGSSGPSLMFEAGEGSARLVRALSETGAVTFANSLSYEVYRNMPNGSDFTAFRDAGTTGLNFAFIEGFHDYHDASDSVERLDRGSLQHHGETMLALTRLLADTPGTLRSGHTAVYFDLFGRLLVDYPVRWASVLAALTVLAFAGSAVHGARRGVLRPGRTAAAAGGVLLVTAAVALAVTAQWWAVLALSPETRALPLHEPYARGGYVAAMACAALALVLAAARAARGRLRPAEWLAGSATVWAVLLCAATVLAPGAGYLFQWPLLAALPALWAAARGGGPAQTASAAAAWLTAPLAVAAVLYAPLADMLLTALGLPLAAVAFVLLCLGALPLLAALGGSPRSRITVPLAAATACALLAATAVRYDYDGARPRPDALVHVSDTAERTFLWVSPDPEPDVWTSRVLDAGARRAPVDHYFPFERPALTSEAPALGIPAPGIAATGERTAAGRRTVDVRITTRRDAWMLQVRLERAAVLECRVGGERLVAADLPEEDGPYLVVQWWGTTAADFSCDTAPGRRLRVDALDLTNGLPKEALALTGPRPGSVAAAPFGYAPTDAAVARGVKTL